MLSALDALAERHIQEAQARGEFDDLPGAGRPLALEDDALVPEELRAAYRLLRNAGFVPPELEAHREIRRIEELLQHATGAEHSGLVARIGLLLSRRPGRRGRGDLRVEAEYEQQLARHLQARRARPSGEPG